MPFLDQPSIGLAFGLPYYCSFETLWSSLVSLFVNDQSLLTYIPYTALTEPFKQRPDIHKLYAAHTVFNRWSAADEVACAVAFLASDAASYVSGSRRAGGMSLFSMCWAAGQAVGAALLGAGAAAFGYAPMIAVFGVGFALFAITLRFRLGRL